MCVFKEMCAVCVMCVFSNDPPAVSPLNYLTLSTKITKLFLFSNQQILCNHLYTVDPPPPALTYATLSNIPGANHCSSSYRRVAHQHSAVTHVTLLWVITALLSRSSRLNCRTAKTYNGTRRWCTMTSRRNR